MRHLLLALQTADPALTRTYILLGVGLLILLLALLAFVYLVVRRSGFPDRLFRHQILGHVDRFLSERAPGFWRFIRARFTIGQWHGLALTVAILVGFGGGYLFALVLENWTSEEELYRIDQYVSEWLAEGASPGTVELMRVLTRFGDSEVVVALAITVGLFLLYRRYRWHVLTLVLAPGLGSAAVVGFKVLYGRTRPGSELANDLGHSFPSGHAFAAMSFYGLLIYLVWRYVRNDWIRISATILFTVIIIIVGASRVLLRVHWVSDVIGGFTLGLTWLVCSILLTHTIQLLLRGSGELTEPSRVDTSS